QLTRLLPQLLGALALQPGLVQEPRLLALAAGLRCPLLGLGRLVGPAVARLLGPARLPLGLAGARLHLGAPLGPRLLLQQLRLLAGGGRARLDLLQLVLGEPVQLALDAAHALAGAAALHAVLLQRVEHAPGLGPQTLLVVADALANLLLQLLGLEQLV